MQASAAACNLKLAFRRTLIFHREFPEGKVFGGLVAWWK
jgi:hypothetical protein